MFDYDRDMSSAHAKLERLRIKNVGSLPPLELIVVHHQLSVDAKCSSLMCTARVVVRYLVRIERIDWFCNEA